MNCSRGFLLLLALAAARLASAATAPDWVARASRTPIEPRLLATHPSPDAVVLWRQQIVTAAPGSGATKLYQREAVRILTPQGSDAATFSSSYDPDSRVDIEGGWTIHADGTVDRLDLKEVVSSQLAHPEYFTDTYLVVFQPPRLAPGDVAASALNRKSRRDVYQWILPLQGPHPIVAQEVVVDLPDGWTHRWRFSGVPEGHSGALSGQGASKASYRLGPQRAVVPESDAPAEGDVRAMFEIAVLPPAGKFGESVFETWDDVARWFHRKSLPARSDPPAELVASLGDDARADATRFVQEKIRYVAVEVGEGGYVPRDPSFVARRLYGDCKDKSFLLMALLDKRGVIAFPVLTRSRENGRIDAAFPSPIQFDHLILAIRVSAATGLPAEVKLRDGAAILFDATDPGTPYGQLPAGLQGSRGLVVRTDGSELVEFPFSRAVTNRLTRTIEGEIAVDGRLDARVTESGEGALSDRASVQSLSAGELDDAIRRFVDQSLPGSRVSKLQRPTVTGPVGSVEWAFSVSSEQYLRRSGDFFLLPLTPLSIGPERIPRLGERRSPIVLGVPAVRQLTATFRLPQGFRVDAFPDPIVVENRYVAYRLSVFLKEGRLVASETYETKEPEIPTVDVASWKELENAVGRAGAAKALIVRGN